VWNPRQNRTYVVNRYSADVTVLRDSIRPGVEELPGPLLREPGSLPAVVRAVLFLPGRSSPGLPPSSLHDITGRRVMDLLPGENDIRHLSPGVYFLRPASCVRRRASSVRKVVVQR